MIKILIIEDNQKLCNELCQLLQRYGYLTYGIKDFSNVLKEYYNTKPDLVLLDINLPQFDGYYFCRQIRQTADVPIIFITSRESTSDEILAMTIGGDDYITKPFDNQVLITRIAAVLKRYRKCSEPDEILTAGEITLDVSSGTLKYCDQSVELSKNENRLLANLLRNKEHIVSRKKLIEMLWDNDEFIDENTLSVNINRIRAKFALINAKDIIHTVRGQGYVIK